MLKNDDSIVIHLPRDKRSQFERLAERKGFGNKSEFGRYLIDREIEKAREEFEFMKSLFDVDQ